MGRRIRGRKVERNDGEGFGLRVMLEQSRKARLARTEELHAIIRGDRLATRRVGMYPPVEVALDPGWVHKSAQLLPARRRATRI